MESPVKRFVVPCREWHERAELGGPAWCSEPAVLVHELGFYSNVHFRIRGRNCDRPVQWSPALELLNQQLALQLGNALHPKMKSDRVEE